MAQGKNQTLPRTAGLKIAHAIAQSGIASRRTAETWVRAGQVTLKGKALCDPAQRLATHEVRLLRVRGAALPQVETARLWRYHKPRGVLVERRGTKTGARKHGKDGKPLPYLDEVLPTPLRGLHPVGRLDLDSEGLLLLTNNGALKRALELPRNAVVRTYRLRVFGVVSEQDLARLARGPKLDGRATQVRTVRLLKAGQKQKSPKGKQSRQKRLPTKKTTKDATKNGLKTSARRSNFWLEVSLAEGRGRELRRLAALFGWRVNRLIRLQYGEVRLGSLAQGASAEVMPVVVERICANLNLESLPTAPAQAKSLPRSSRATGQKAEQKATQKTAQKITQKPAQKKAYKKAHKKG